MSRRTYTPEQKAEAIARVTAGEQVKVVSQQMSIDRTAIQHWLGRDKIAAQVTALVTQQKPSLMGLIGDYLESNLGALRSQASRMAERTWIEAQTTPDLIAAHDHLGRRLVSILDRIHPRDRDDDEPTE